jgi:hypothetical protein
MTACMILSIGAFFIPVSQAGLIFAIFPLFGLIMPVPMVTVTSLLVEEGRAIYKDRCVALACGIVSAILAMRNTWNIRPMILQK